MVKITICGCGNASHLMTALITHKNLATLSLYAPFQSEASDFRKALSTNDNQLQIIGPTDSQSFTVKVDPSIVTDDAKTAIGDSDLIILPLPAFAIEPTFKQIEPYLKKGAIVGVMPGQGGSQWAACRVFGNDFFAKNKRDITLFAMEKLPYNVRVEKYGNRVKVYGYKKISVGCIPKNKNGEVREMLEKYIPEMRTVGLENILVTTLTTGNQCIHPARFYSLEKKQPWERNPLFYEEMDDEAVRRIQAVSDEIGGIARGMERKVKGVDLKEVLDIKKAMVVAYGDEIRDQSGLKSILRTNKGFEGITSPMKENEEGKWVVNWDSRYVKDDVPYGLCVLKGLAEMVDVKVPMVDELIVWAQKGLGKSYMVDGKLCGDDVKETGAPQAFGFKSFGDLPDVRDPGVDSSNMDGEAAKKKAPAKEPALVS